jgi:hypothetical protein
VGAWAEWLGWLAGAFVVAALFVVPIRRGEWGAGFSSETYPSAIAEKLRQARLPGHLFNGDEWGGYLAWALPGQTVFVDGTHYTMDRSLVEYGFVLDARPGWKQLLARYDITSVVVPVLQRQGTVAPLVPALSTDPDWVLVALGPRAGWWVRASLLERLPDLTPLPKAALTTFAMERAEAMAQDPRRRTEGWKTAAVAALALGERERARRDLTLYLQQRPDDAQAARLLSLL